MDVELAVIVSLLLSITYFTDGIFWMAHLNLLDWIDFENNHKKSSVDLLFPAEVAFLIIFLNLCMLFQCMF